MRYFPRSRYGAQGVSAAKKAFFVVVLITISVSLQAQWATSPGDPNDIYNTNSGEVGVGTNAPKAKLHVKNGSFLVDGTAGTAPVSGPGTRMMFVPSRSAFRAGSVNGPQWDMDSLGSGSVALGSNSQASGAGTVAIGSGNIARSVSSVAIGNQNTVEGTGVNLAIGYANRANGWFCNALGYNNEVTGLGASAFGFTNKSTGLASFAFGIGTHAAVDYSMTLGEGIGGVPLKNEISHSLMIGFRSDSASLYVGPSNGLGTTGPVGIGTTGVPAGYKLAVKGKIIAEELKVKLNQNWPDYVFEDAYPLASLEEVEDYIEQNHHLPGIPSAEEVEQDGITVGEMNAKLLEKIEEQTLYLIELQKQVKALQEEVGTLKGEE